MSQMVFRTLDDCRKAGISVSSFTIPCHSQEVYVLNGDFEMIRGPVFTFYKKANVIINESKSNPALANVDNLHARRWDEHKEYLLRAFFDNEIDQFASRNKVWRPNRGSDKPLCAIETEWSRVNIFHALFDAFGKLAVLEMEGNIDECAFLISEKACYLKAILKLFGYDVVVYPDNMPLSGTFKIPSMVHNSGYISAMLKQFFLRQRQRVEGLASSVDGENLYIARKGARTVINEAQVLDEISKRLPVRKIYLEDLTFFEQIRVIAQSNLVIGPHGAGLSWCIFKNHGAVLELVSPNYDNRCFSGLQSDHVGFFRCEPPDRDKHSLGVKSDPFVVDIGHLDCALQRMLDAAAP